MNLESIVSFHDLLDLAVRSAQIRLSRQGLISLLDQDRSRFEDIATSATMICFAQQCRKYGCDLRDSPFWPLLEGKSAYVQRYEFRREVRLQKLSREALTDAIRMKNIILWNDWRIEPDDGTEDGGDSGLSIWKEHFLISRSGSKPFHRSFPVDHTGFELSVGGLYFEMMLSAQSAANDFQVATTSGGVA